MMPQLTKLMETIEDHDVKFIRLVFCDIFGIPKNIAIMTDRLPQAVEKGISFDASAISGFSNVEESDLFLFPDLSTFALLPWRPSEGCVARLFCCIRYPDGRPFEGDGRYLLQAAQEKAQADGYGFLVGPECEFYLFETDEKGAPTLTPFDKAGYLDVAPMDKGENVRRDICLTLEEMGVHPERSHHEHGPGQNEIDIRCASPMRAVDDFVTLHTAVKAVSEQNGLFASFLPKPLPEESGNGLHINLSLLKNGENLFAKFDTDVHARAFLAGILRRIVEITVFANPLPGSYLRFGKCEAPCVVNWSKQNRSTLVRVPAATGSDARMELRSPDPSCNLYLLTALLLHAGMEGVAEGLTLGEAFDGNVYVNDVAGFEALPDSLQSAVQLAKNSAFLKRVLPEKLLCNYLRDKEREAAAFTASEAPHAYEIARYFERI